MRIFQTMATALLGVLLVAGQALAGTADVSGGWELQSEREGIRIYTRSVHGTSLKQIRAVTVVNAPMSAVMQVLTDYDNYKSWMNNIQESYVMEEMRDSVAVIYEYEDAPWPVQNRFRVQEMTLHLGSDVSTLVFKSIPDESIVRNDAIQMEHHEGWWRVSQISDSNCQIEFMLDGDPGGYVPAWLVNYMAVDAPFRTLSNLRNRIAESQRS